tara:strand:+ start:513 stop:1118 length:606 start_codon:yes stop_codon:yes gene_type:complete
MKKSKETKEILKEWRKFEFKNKKLNEAQSSSTPPQRIRYKPSQKAIDLKKELEGEYGKGSFYCYDFFDNHQDYEMLDPNDGGYQIEIETLVDQIKGMQEFPSDIGVSDIVMTEDDIFMDTASSPDALANITAKGQFDIQIQSGTYQGRTETYYYGYIDINGRKQKIIYNSDSYSVYYLFPDSDSQQAPRKKFKLRLGGAWN